LFWLEIGFRKAGGQQFKSLAFLPFSGLLHYMVILVTGSAGFVGKHLIEALSHRPDVEVIGYDRDSDPAMLQDGLARADVIFHLAGVNRPQNPDDFRTGNTEFTEVLCARLEAFDRKPLIVFASSIQAVLRNPYGASKLQAENALAQWAAKTGASVVVFRLQNVFGKWCRPNYNSVTATFCHNIAHDMPITISDPNRELELVYIDDVAAGFLAVLDELPKVGAFEHREIPKYYKLSLGKLAARIQSFRESRKSLLISTFDDEFTKRLYATYLSYLAAPDFAYHLAQKIDSRGSLAEFVKSPGFGQIFVSRTLPGVTRGNHYHHTKTEKFLVVEGEAIIRFRQINSIEVIEHRVSGREFKVVDIPPGYIHSIENIGHTEMVVLFWASEIFDPATPDTYFAEVLNLKNKVKRSAPPSKG
jgi:UDP-2-acetamido-2,6-beta-L-arabino-hexul-4-ose reductase